MNVPLIKVGIMSEPQVAFAFSGDYRCGDTIVTGRHEASVVDDKILWNGKSYADVLFEPVDSSSASFELHNVTIGVNFHWQRKENQRFRGALHLIVENGCVTTVNILSVEEYLVSVISSEMSATASENLLKAHAVISRSWLLAQIDKTRRLAQSADKYVSATVTDDEILRWYDREDHVNFDVCADDHCQRYQGITRASTPVVRKAVDETCGEVLMYGASLCDARFSKCCGGVLEQFEACWEPVHHNYLEPRSDSPAENVFPDLTVEENAREWILSSPEAFCNTTDATILSQVLNNYDQETTNFYRWKVEYSQNELSELVHRRSGIDFGNIIDLVPVERGVSGRLIRLKIVGDKRTMTIGKELEIRRTLSPSHLYSSAFVVERNADDNGNVRFTLHGAGWGHGVGLCQIGAAVMGAKGYNYREILMHYFVDAEIKKLYNHE